MMEYLTQPRWLYKEIEVDNLTEIQQELLPILYNTFPDFDNESPHFTSLQREQIEPYAPLYRKFIDSLGILDRWSYCAFVTTNLDKKFPVHVDSLIWQERCYGLNLPLINCEGTYTVFYDAEIEEMPFMNNGDSRYSARRIKPGTVPTEIGRLEASNPAWVNTSIPHAPVSTHSKPRAIISARFRPEVHDLIYA